MYGLREAPAIWQKVVQEMMAELGFVACATVPCVYHHVEKKVVAVAHVDDFLMSGDKSALLELRRELPARYECDGDVLSPGTRRGTRDLFSRPPDSAGTWRCEMARRY